MHVFLDANILFSASNASSNMAKLAQLLLERAEVLTSDLACEEARRNILIKRPAWAGSFEEIVSRIQVVGSVVFALSVPLDEKDVPILCAAIRAKCHYLVTGDKRDFGHLIGQTVNGVTIVSPAQMAGILVSQDVHRG